MKRVITISFLVLAMIVGVSYGFIESQADSHEDITERFYSGDVSLEERFAYELHVVVDAMLCDCEDEYALPFGNGIQTAVERRVHYLDASAEEKDNLKKLADDFVSLPENNLEELESQINSIEEQLNQETDPDEIEELEAELSRLETLHTNNKDVLKNEIQEIHDLVVTIDERTNGRYYISEHERKGI
ncbi:hypothetical protein [Alkalibacillus almallahensis]|uniref:hypothetical protein n=1 Tax=Alkalibacillus almallahensis TaxID=1379154 RepID=UPI0014249A51|nr:hypothetical protein [Alkalibacillus almallahensis]NIK12754.1 septal ring factor EnvC (AmiA/AmiB activator) [Alkalibacillus almallahensis]